MIPLHSNNILPSGNHSTAWHLNPTCRRC